MNPKICVISLCINEWYAYIVKYSLKVLKLYCEKHNYDLFIPNEVYDGKRDCPWYKVLAIKKYLSQYNYVVWFDIDGFIMKPHIKLEKFISKMKHDILCSGDFTSLINTGILFIKNTPFSHLLLDYIWTNKNSFDTKFHEQASLIQLYNDNILNCKNKIKIISEHERIKLFCYYTHYQYNKSFFFHMARCSHDPICFILSLDSMCPIKMDEETEEQYQYRLNYLTDTKKYIEFHKLDKKPCVLQRIHFFEKNYFF